MDREKPAQHVTDSPHSTTLPRSSSLLLTPAPHGRTLLPLGRLPWTSGYTTGKVGVWAHGHAVQAVGVGNRHAVRAAAVQTGRAIPGPLPHPPGRPRFRPTVPVGVGEDLDRFAQPVLQRRPGPEKFLLLLRRVQPRKRPVRDAVRLDRYPATFQLAQFLPTANGLL